MENSAAHWPLKIGKSPKNWQKWYQFSLLGGTSELGMFYTFLLNLKNIDILGIPWRLKDWTIIQKRAKMGKSGISLAY